MTKQRRKTICNTEEWKVLKKQPKLDVHRINYLNNTNILYQVDNIAGAVQTSYYTRIVTDYVSTAVGNKATDEIRETIK